MQQLPIQSISRTKAQLPTDLAARCGHCGGHENLRLIDEWAVFGHMRYNFTTCPNPNCKQQIYFVITNFTHSNNVLGGGDLFMHPSVESWEAPAHLSESLVDSPELQKDFNRAVKYMNDGDYISVAVAVRRALEGLAAKFVPQEKLRSTLSEDLKLLTVHHDLTDTIFQMSSVINKAGNLGAHFGASRVSADIATSCLSMATDLLQMHFSLEKRVDQLKTLVEKAKSEVPSEWAEVSIDIKA